MSRYVNVVVGAVLYYFNLGIKHQSHQGISFF